MKSQAKLSDKKVVISGDVVEFYDYEEPYGYNLQSDINNPEPFVDLSEDQDEQKESNKENSESKKEMLERSARRSRRNLRRLISANADRWQKESDKYYQTKFVTLTFEDNVTDIEEANSELTNFIKRLNYHYFGEKKNRLKYTVVIEFQKRGAIHYHALFCNLEWIDKSLLADIWGHGFVRINELDDIDSVGAYVCKYLTKESMLNSKMQDKKKYFSSRGLIRPTVVRNQSDAEFINSLISSVNPEYNNSFGNEHTGEVNYNLFDLSDKDDLSSKLHMWLNDR